jgi:hypothetical protein
MRVSAAFQPGETASYGWGSVSLTDSVPLPRKLAFALTGVALKPHPRSAFFTLRLSIVLCPPQAHSDSPEQLTPRTAP